MHLLVVLSLLLSPAAPAAASIPRGPRRAPLAPTPSPTVTVTVPTVSPTAPTATPTATATASPTALPTGTPTATATATATATPSPTATATPLPTVVTPPPTITPTPTPTDPVTPPITQPVTILPGVGGVLVSPDGRLLVSFPPGAVDEPIEAGFTALPPLDLGPDQHLFYRFDLSAWPAGQPDLPPPAFLEPVVVTVTYSLTDVQGLQEDTLALVTFDEAQDAWVPVSATLDVTDSRLTASLSHFSGYGILGEGEDVFFTPHIEAGQISLFTGDSSFSYELDVPAGAGGLNVPLTLRYSGGTVNGMASASDTDGGWVGTGWTLDLGGIELQHEQDRDYYFLTLNSVSEKLVMDVEGTETNCADPTWGPWNCKTSTSTYRTEQESFLRISRISRTLTHPCCGPNCLIGSWSD